MWLAVCMVPGVAACLPGLHAVPTEAVSAHLTGHMHASAIFLNSVFAFGTFLCICHDPEVIFRLGGQLELPLLHKFAGEWCMGVMSAAEAEFSCTIRSGAGDVSGTVGMGRNKSYFSTPRGRAPSHCTGGLNKISGQVHGVIGCHG